MARRPTTRPSARTAIVAKPAGGLTRLPLYSAVLISTGFLVYWNSLSTPFLFDDESSILKNAQIRALSALGSVLSPPRATPVAGRPLVNLSFALNYALGGLDVRGYHVFNLGIHILAALILFGIVRRTLGMPALRARFGARSTGLAWACAMVWMLHPLQTEAVNYLSERTESMMGLFYLLTLYCSIRAAGERGASMWRVASVLACASGMACKESMVTVPVIVALYDRVFLFDSLKESFRARGSLYAALAATWLGLAALMFGGPRSDSVGFSIGTSPWTYLLNQTLMIVRYLRLTVWPRGLVLDYGLPQTLVLGDVLPAALFVVCLLLATVVALVYRPRLGFLGAWFFITLAPTTSVIPIVTEVGAERRMYLPLAAVAVFAVLIAQWLADRAVDSRPSARALRARLPAAGMIALTCACALLAAGTILRNREYASRLNLARTIVERWPHGRAHYLLGTELIAVGDHDEAMEHLWLSARDYPGARFALGIELIGAGKVEEGLGQLDAFVHDMPSHVNVPPAREMIGRTLMSQGKLDEAATEFGLLLELAPSYVDAHGYLGDILLMQKRFPEAIVQYQTLLGSRPTSARTQGNLGIAFAASGHLDEAILCFQHAIDADPDAVDARRNLARALLQTGRPGQAAAHARQILRQHPDDPVAHTLLGLALASEQNLDEAIPQFRRSLEIDPGDLETRENLTLALRLKNGHPDAR
jgi:tetratricopeptide (TPR) repeat protein